MLREVVAALACPVCGRGLAERDGSLACAERHSFDVARQGYVSLLAAGAGTHTADSPEMLEARSRFLSAGHYQPIERALAGELEFLDPAVPGPVVDLGAGTGRYLAGLLDGLPGRFGIALDNSKHAARRAARAHPRAGAAVCDVWHGLPLRDRSAAAAIVVFSPRNGPEIARALAPGGRAVVVTPGPDHLAELVEALGLIGVDADKEERLEASMDPLGSGRAELLEWRLELSREQALDLVLMGPNARRRRREEWREAVAALPEPLAVTAQIRVSRFV